MENFFTKTLPRQKKNENTVNNPSFEDKKLLGSWAVRLNKAYKARKFIEWWRWEEIYKPDGISVEWWDGNNVSPHYLIEKVSDIKSDGQYSLHIHLSETTPEGLVEAREKRLQIGQVIPYEFLDWLEYFSLDYYIPCSPNQNNPQGTIKLNFIAESIGGKYLNIETYTLYDSKKNPAHVYNEWQTFKQFVKKDFHKPFVRWKDIEFMIFFIEIENSSLGSLDVYFDNIQTADTFSMRKFLNDPDRSE